MNNIYNYFAGANTKYGFYNKFEEINDKQKLGFKYVIKGGAGTGKSTLMKKVSKYFWEKGYTIEHFYCSSDSNSLDGVRIVEKNICIVDGTSPHITEATLPMINDKIINVGEFVNEKIKINKKVIKNATAKKQKYFALCYDYVKCASDIYENCYKIYQKNHNKKDIDLLTREVLEQIKIKNKKPTIARQLFLDNIEKNGLNTIQPTYAYKNIFINSNQYTANLVLKEVSLSLCSQGYVVVEILNLLMPANIKALFLPELNLIIENFDIEIKKQKDKNILQFNNQIINKLLLKAGYFLDMAKKEHKKIEKYYIKNMDFLKLDKLTQKIIYEIDKK